MAIGPPAIAGLEASQVAMSVAKKNDLNVLATVQFGLMRFLNGMSMGIIGSKSFEDSATFAFGKKDGGFVDLGIGTRIPAGSLLKVIGTGAFMMLTDWGMSFLTGNRETKVIGTNMTATGTR